MRTQRLLVPAAILVLVVTLAAEHVGAQQPPVVISLQSLDFADEVGAAAARLSSVRADSAWAAASVPDPAPFIIDPSNIAPLARPQVIEAFTKRRSAATVLAGQRLAAGGVFGTSFVRDLRAAAPILQAFVGNTIGAVQGVDPGAVQQCFKSVAQLGARLTRRAVEYATAIVRPAWDAILQIIATVYSANGGRLRVDPKPTLWRLENPAAVFRNGALPRYTNITRGTMINPTSRSYIFVHGMGFNGSASEAFNGYYSYFEQAMRWFAPNGQCTPARPCDIYMLAYDSRLPTGPINTAIAAAIIKAASSAVGTAVEPILLAMVAWRELERRAQVTGDHLANLLNSVPSAPPGSRGTLAILSHSLGSQTTARSLNKLMSYASPRSPVLAWVSFNGALPNNALSPAGGITPAAARGAKRILNFHSFLDAALSTLYLAGAGVEFAMGMVGSTYTIDGSFEGIFNIDTTGFTGPNHEAGPMQPPLSFAGNYFQLLSKFTVVTP